jgi:hypothetical protein
MQQKKLVLLTMKEESLMKSEVQEWTFTMTRMKRKMMKRKRMKKTCIKKMQKWRAMIMRKLQLNSIKSENKLSLFSNRLTTLQTKFNPIKKLPKTKLLTQLRIKGQIHRISYKNLKLYKLIIS